MTQIPADRGGFFRAEAGLGHGGAGAMNVEIEMRMGRIEVVVEGSMRTIATHQDQLAF
jgi:hypothetical protein